MIHVAVDNSFTFQPEEAVQGLKEESREQKVFVLVLVNPWD